MLDAKLAGIRRSEFYPISDTYFSPFLQIRENLTHKETAIAPCNVDCDPASDMNFKSASDAQQPTSTKEHCRGEN